LTPTDTLPPCEKMQGSRQNPKQTRLVEQEYNQHERQTDMESVRSKGTK